LKTSVNIFNNLNESFENEFKVKKKVIIESDSIKEEVERFDGGTLTILEKGLTPDEFDSYIEDQRAHFEGEVFDTESSMPWYDDVTRLILYSDDDSEGEIIIFYKQDYDETTDSITYTIYDTDSLNESCKKLKEEVDLKQFNDKDDESKYQMLDRLRQDCEYFLNNQRSEKALWTGNVKDQIAKMKELYNQIKEKPEWLTMQDIEDYEKKMTSNDINENTLTEEDNTEEITPAEKKILDAAQTSNSEYTLDNISIETTSEGNTHIMTKDGKDIVTIGPLSDDEKEDLRLNGYYKTNLDTNEPSTKENSDNLTEEDTVLVPNVEVEPDYIINDVTVLNQIDDGDVQAPDIEGLLTLVNENLSNKYGNNWGKIKTLSSKVNDNNSFALVDIYTPEIIKEFEEKGISDVAIGKSLILENVGKLLEFKVNSLNGVTRYSKKTQDPVTTITEWVETEFLHEAMVKKAEEAEFLKVKNEEDTIADYINNRPELKMELENIKMFIDLSKQVKAEEEMKPSIQDRMYGFATEFPASIQISNKNDKYELSFTTLDQIVEKLFGKEWVKETSEDNKIVGLKESYSQFNIGDIEVVFNPDTYECLYSIPAADVKDKKINLTKVPSVETPYDTDTIIKSYVETKFGQIPTEEEKEVDNTNQEIETPIENTDNTDNIDNTTSTEIDQETSEPELHEDELPDEPTTDNVPTENDTEEVQSETGEASFVKIRPNQESNIEAVRARMLDGDTPKSSYIVVNTIDISAEEWNNLINNLSAPQSFLENVKPIDRKNYSFNVVKVTSQASDTVLLIDPLGYNYPRYLSIEG
jgi:hypothetical protein